MSLWQRALVARQVIGKQLNVLTLITGRAAVSEDFSRARQRLTRWQRITAQLLADHISPEIGQEFIGKYNDVAGIMHLDALSQVRLIYQTYLYHLLEELKYSPDNLLAP